MQIFLFENVLGFFVLNRDGLFFEISFPEYEEEPIEKFSEDLLLVEERKLPELLKEMLQRLVKDGYTEISTTNAELVHTINEIEGITAKHVENHPIYRQIQRNLSGSLSQVGMQLQPHQENLQKYTKEIAEYMMKKKIAEISTRRDLHIKMAVETLSDINKTLNTLTTRLREWYGLHFPELTQSIIPEGEQYVELVSKIEKRENYTPEIMAERLELGEEFQESLIAKAKRSMGGTLTAQDEKIVLELADSIKKQYDFRNRLSNYLERLVSDLAPNLGRLVGTALTAQLISLAGGLEELSRLPSSTIQLLGAEKSLFKSLRYGGDTPKHGVIFQWHGIRTAKYYHRGKIARLLAGKLTICARVDFFNGDFVGDKILEDVERKIKGIEKRYPHPPKKKQSKKYSGRKKKRGKRKKSRYHKKGGRR